MYDLRQFLDKFVVYTNDSEIIRALEKENFKVLTVIHVMKKVFAKEFIFLLPGRMTQTVFEAKKYIRRILGRCLPRRKRKKN